MTRIATDPLLQSLFTLRLTLPILLAWGVVLALGLGETIRAFRRSRTEALAVCALAVLTAVPRLLVPWGPLDFSESERTTAAWTLAPAVNPPMFAFEVPLLAGSLAGVDVATVLRASGLVGGVLAVVATYALARTARLDRAWCVLAALVVCAWPTHIRYSASTGNTVWAGAWLAFLFATAGAREMPRRARSVLTAALLVLAIGSRTELRVPAVGVLALACAPAWSWRDRAAAGALVALALVPFGYQPAPDRIRTDMFFQLLCTPSVMPVWFVAGGTIGVFAGRFPRAMRIALGFALVTGTALYAQFSNEVNPLWGPSRYTLVLVPLWSVGTVALLARLTVRRERVAQALSFGALGLQSVAYGPLLARRIDVQEEFRFVRETAPQITRAWPDVVVLANEPVSRGPLVDGLSADVALGLAAATGRTNWPPSSCGGPVSRPVALWADAAVHESCAHRGPDRSRVAVFVGMYRADTRVRAFGRLAPLVERTVRAAPMTFGLDRDCNTGSDYGRLALAVEGRALGDCPLTFGWYTLAP